MMRKVRVVKYGQQPVMNKPGYSRGFNSGQFPIYYPGTEWVKPTTEVNKGLKPVPWDQANVEAEGGETAYVPDQGGLPAHFTINGPRHSEGGVPLNLPPDTFIYSDTKKMKLKGPILEYFGKNSNKSYTPAEIAKQYDINKYRKILQNPDSDPIQRHSAELMIQNYNKKLGALSLVQEAKKGFPDGIPVAAIPFLMTYAIEPDSVLPQIPGQGAMPPMGMPPVAQYGSAGTWAAPNFYSFGGSYRAQTEPEFGGNWMGQAYSRKQYGGQEEEILQLIQMYAQATGQDPDEVVSQLQQMQPEEAQQALQQMAQSLQQTQSEAASFNYGGSYMPKAQDGKTFQSYSGANDPSTGYWDRVSKANLFKRPEGPDEVAIDPQYARAVERMIPFYGEDPGFLGTLQEWFMAPQKEINHLLTGYYETPGTTLQRYYPDFTEDNKFFTDLATDPLIVGNLAGKAAYKGLQKVAPGIAGAALYAGEKTAKGAKYLGKKLAPYVKKVSPQGVTKVGMKVGQVAAHKGSGESRPEAGMVAQPYIAPAASTTVAPSVIPMSPIVPEFTEAEADSALKAMGLIKQYGGYIPMAQFGNSGNYGFGEDPIPHSIQQPTGDEVYLNLNLPRTRAEVEAQRDSIAAAQKAKRIAAEKAAFAKMQNSQAATALNPNKPPAPASPKPAPGGGYPKNSVVTVGPDQYITDANGNLFRKIPKSSAAKISTGQTAQQPAQASQPAKTATQAPAATTTTAPAKGTATSTASSLTFDPTVTSSNDPMWDTGLDLLKKNFKGNEKLKNALYEEWKARPENKGKSLTPEEVLDNFLKTQEHIYAIQKSLSEADKKSGKWDKGTKKNEVYNKTATKLGLTPLTEDEIANFQSTYIALYDLNKKAKDPEIRSVLDQFNLTPVGVADDQFGDQKNISKVDSWFGNTTLGQAVTPKYQPAPAAPTKEQETKPLDTPTVNYYPQTVNAPWWAQDLVNIYGAAGDFLRLKKYLPWAPETEPVIPETVFYDPTRELAANAEQMAIASQAASTFGAPQQFNARFSETQGKGAENAANIMGRYNNMNVGTANRAASENASIFNRANEIDARRAQDLYDKTTVANQQFDNERSRALNNLRQAYITGISNKAQAQAVNTMHPDYQVDPSRGGYVYHNPFVREMEPTDPTQAGDFDSWMESHQNLDPADAVDVWLRLQEGSGSTRVPARGRRGSGNPYQYPGMASNAAMPYGIPMATAAYPYDPYNPYT